ncbi:MAG TPA: ABC transporter permease, partial [Candidatus Nanoarchaeia archaeon]|nr:ABC transporter permease [Candidatus Nanoarchaeia archaeon]
MIKFSIRNLLKRKTRSLLTLSGIIIGVAMIISLVSVSEGLSKLATDFVSNFQGIFVMQRDAPDDMFSRVELKDAGSIASIAGVKSVSGQINGIVTNVDGSGSASLYGGSLDFFV